MKWYKFSSIYATGYTGETPIVTLKENNVELSRKSTLAAMTAGSYFHDIEKRRVYIWPIESDNPNSNGKAYVFYVLLGFCDTEASYPIQGEPEQFYIPCINSESAPPFSQSITELFTGQITNGFGEISLTCPEWFFLNKDNYIWKNSECRALYGEVGGSYGNYKIILYGLIEKITISETGGGLSLIDIRDRIYTTLPPGRFEVSEFPYLDTEIVSNSRPVLVGEKQNIIPNLINTVTRTYEISQVSFDFYTFPGIEEIGAIFKDGVLLTPGVDYSVDLANGQFTLIAPPGESLITCTAKGLKISRDFSVKTWTNTYTENIADITYFYLRIQPITEAYIDESGFETLQAARAGFQCGDWLDQSVDFYEKLKELQSTGQFQLLPTPSGKLGIIPYIDTEVAKATLNNNYYNGLTITKGEEVYSRVIVKFDRAPAGGNIETTGGDRLEQYQYYTRIDGSTAFLYQNNKEIQFKTIVNNRNDAQAIANTMGGLYNRPSEIISFQTNHEAMEWQLLDKLEINYSEIIDGVDTLIYNQVPFLIIAKNITWNGYISITARISPANLSGQYWTDQDGNVITDQNGNGITT